MRFLILLLALLATSAQAQTTTVGRYYLTAPDGSTLGSGLQYNTDCKKIAAADAAKASAGSKVYRCVFDITIAYPAPVTWTKLVDENKAFSLTAPADVRFGAGSAWIQKAFAAGTFACTNTVFGKDPAPNVFKQCQTSSTQPTVPPKPDDVTRTVQCVAPSVGSWTQTATWTLTGTTWTQGTFAPTAAPAGACTTPTDPGTPPTGKLQVTRTTCTAPCAVLFDATAMGDFRDTYMFDFGDPKPDTWAVSGKSKNSESGGPIAAHVYLTPGSFTAKVNGDTVTIAVSDPAAAYAGMKTVCIGKDFTGCPAGAAQQSGLPSGTAWSGKRWLLHTGESFGDISILDGNSGVQVGSYGSGAKPVVASVGVGNWRPTTANFATDITVMDLNVSNGISQSIGSRVLVLRNDVHSAKGSGGIPLSMGELDYWYRGDQFRTVPQSAFYNAREVFFVENNAIGTNTVDGSSGFWGDGSRVAMLGNRLGRYQQHTVRFSALDRAILAHNELQGISADGIRHSLKLHSMGFNAYADGAINDTSGRGGWVTSKVVIANNLLGNAADNNTWTAILGPQNNTVGEGLEDIIVENNRFVRGPNTSTDLIIQARRVTVRGNATSTGAKLVTGSDPNPEVPAAWSSPNYIQ